MTHERNIAKEEAVTPVWKMEYIFKNVTKCWNELWVDLNRCWDQNRARVWKTDIEWQPEQRALYTGKRSNFNSYLCISLTVMYCQNIWYEWCATLIWYNKNSKSKGGSSFLVGRKGGKRRRLLRTISDIVNIPIS